MGKISVDGFLREYGVAAKQNKSAMETFIKKHITTQYVDFMTKNVYCDKIIESTCHIKDGNREFIKINSVSRDLFFTMRLIQLYTDIKLDEENIIGEYDKLNEVGAIDVIIEAIPDSEYIEFSDMLNKMLGDFLNNEYSVNALLYNLKESFSMSGEIINEVLNSPEMKKLLEQAKEE